MPISYTIDLQRHLVLTKCWGVLTDDELLAHKEKLAKDPAFNAAMGQLTDARTIERLTLTTEGVKLMVAHDATNAERIAGHREALVVSSDEAFGMARMYSQRSEGGPKGIAVFRSMTEAEAWLASGLRPADESK